MNEIIVKDVEFNGDVIKAVQDAAGIIWVGVSWICNGIGMDRGMKNRQVANIQTDIVLKGGCIKFDAGVFDPNNTTLAIQLDYVPLWLAKISITPTMQRDCPELVEKLVTYQLKAKDVLAAAFLPQKESETDALWKEIREIKNILNTKFDRWNSDMSRALNLLLKTQNVTLIEGDHRFPVQKTFNRDYKAWKDQVYFLATEIMKYDYRYTQNRAVLSAAYYRMRDVYGFVYEQAEREYLDRHGDTGERPHTIDVVYDDKTYRTVLVPILKDMLEDAKCMSTSEKMDNIIEPLVRKFNDKTPHHCAVYRRIFVAMERNGEVSWKNRITRYQKAHATKRIPNKKIIVAESANLMRKFAETAEKLMKEIE